MFKPAERLRNIRKSATRVLYDSAPPGSINIGLGEPDFRTPEIIRREAIRVIEEEQIGYTPNSGLIQLREKIAAYHSEGLDRPFNAKQVCVMNGSEEALFATIMSIVGPGDEALMPDPAYIAYPQIADIAGAKSVYYSMPAARGFAFDRESFKQALSERTKLVFILSPSNPTSRVISRDDLRFIADCLAGTDAYVIADEIYREIYFDERPATISEFYDKTIIVSGLSKSMSMTGWRVGWAVGPEDAIRHITVMHQYVSTCASAVTQRASVAAFSDEGRAATATMRNELKRRRDVMARAIERELHLPYVLGEGAFYIMLDVSSFGPSMDIALALLNERVITVPGSAFGSEGEGYLRLSFSIEPSLIEEGVSRIRAGLDKATRAD
ncbi:MAG TPA: aminotransferase class I/II-fold pyridoxal phosphate-dependent enzyme [Blastocatellia bacterium]|nr:aminotransferase class I/II-fold pyridoxal phosphate-dependent enzyme [Blastocatellia bacterium]